MNKQVYGYIHLEIGSYSTLFCFLTSLLGLRDLSSLTWDRTLTAIAVKVLILPLDPQEFLRCLTLVTPWTVAHQPPWDFPGKSTGVVCHFLLQGIFLTQVLNLGLLYCRWILNCLSNQGSP